MDQRTATLSPDRVGTAPGRGVQVNRVAPISLERTAVAGKVDGPGTWDHGSTAREGRTREGVVFKGMLVS